MSSNLLKKSKESSGSKKVQNPILALVFLHTKYCTYSHARIALALNTEQGTAMLLTLNHALASVNPTVLTAGSEHTAQRTVEHKQQPFEHHNLAM